MSSMTGNSSQVRMRDITVRRPIEWISAAVSDVGTVRAVNEDALLDKPEHGLWVVADGMGGHEAGNIASRMITEALDELGKPDNLNQFINQIEQCLIDVNERLLEYSEIMLDGRVIGSTVLCLVIYRHIGVCIWMGDSRLYRFRGGTLTQITRDHSQVSELLQAGAITHEEAQYHPEANVITRAVGTSDVAYLDMDVFSLHVGDTLLLCSDGLYNAVDTPGITSALENPEPAECAAVLIEQALTNGATDNVSLIVVRGVRKSAADMADEESVDDNER